jgi:hypothetical protein
VPPTTIVISGADFSAVNLTYIKDSGSLNWYPAGYNSGSDPYIEFSNDQYGIRVPGFGQALYVNAGTLNIPLAQWDTNPPLGSVAPTGAYTYSTTDVYEWKFGADGNLTLPANGKIRAADNTGGTGGYIEFYGAGGEGNSDNTSTTSGDIDIVAGVDGGYDNDNTNNNLNIGNIRLKTKSYTEKPRNYQ